MTEASQTEAELLELAKHGDRRAFDQLLAPQLPRLRNLVRRMVGDPQDTADLVQDVLLRAYTRIGAFRGESSLSTWLYAIASRLCLNRLAGSERRLARHGEETLTRLPDGRPGPDQALERGEIEEALHRAIGELAEERRIVVILRDVEGLAYEEIAEALELPVGTVRSRLHRARLDLKEKLERFFP